MNSAERRFLYFFFSFLPEPLQSGQISGVPLPPQRGQKDGSMVTVPHGTITLPVPRHLSHFSIFYPHRVKGMKQGRKVLVLYLPSLEYMQNGLGAPIPTKIFDKIRKGKTEHVWFPFTSSEGDCVEGLHDALAAHQPAGERAFWKRSQHSFPGGSTVQKEGCGNPRVGE